MTTRTPASRKGFVAVALAASIIALLGIGAFAVDLGLLYAKRGQLQKAADLGALAGANARIIYGEDADRIRSVAVQIARANLEAQDIPASAITDADVTFPAADEIEITVFRTNGHGNPVHMFLAPALGIAERDVTATARAGIVSACSSACILPVTIPAKFTWDDTCATEKTKYVLNGELDVDSSAEVASIQVLGYTDSDIGTSLTIKYGNPADSFAPGFYSPVDFPPLNKDPHPITGAAAYNENISGCSGSNNIVVEIGDELQMEPGNMTGPTKSGFQTAIDADPGAYWDSGSQSVRGSAYEISPRIRPMAFYDPSRPPVSGRNSLFVYQFGAVFIEAVDPSGDIAARFVHTVAKSPVASGGECLLRTAVLLRDSTR